MSEHFKRHEFACGCGCGFAAMDEELVDVLEAARAHFGVPITVTSGCRCAAHNAAVGGSPGSKHKHGMAADIQVKNTDPAIVAQYFRRAYPRTYGIGEYKSWTHIDVRPERARWVK